MKLKAVFIALASCLALCGFTSCDKEEEDETLYNKTEVSTKSLTAPQFEKYLTTTVYTGVTFRVRFNNGGDDYENMRCIVHWKKYASKQTITPSKSDMTNHDSMRIYGATSSTTTFDKAHTGINGGTYIYYYFECSNSRHTTKTEVTHCVVKRL